MTPGEQKAAQAKFQRELIPALIDLDLDWGRRWLCKNPAVDDFIVLATMHRYRMNCAEIPPQHTHLRNQSAGWLADNGWPLEVKGW